MRLSKKEIKYLSASFQNSTNLSLFKNIEADVDGTEYKSLVEKGIIVGNAYETKALEILMLLSSVVRSSRFIVQNPFFIVEKYTYSAGDKLILAENYEGELEFSYLEDINEISIKLSEIFGMSKIVNTEINEVFTPDEMVVLYSVIDMVRIAALKNYAGDDNKKFNFSEEEITGQLNSDYKNGFAQVFTSNYNYIIPDNLKISGILDSLANKGAIKKESEYSLEGEYLKFANNFLIIESISMYESFEIQSDGEIAAVAKLAISSGIHDIVAMYFDGEMVDFSTVSAKQLLFNIEDFMKCPEFEKKSEKQADEPLAEVANQQPKAVTKSGDWVCQKCGKQNSGKFCAGCGTPMT